MAIDTQCPSCAKQYKLKDDLAGKRVTCGNPTCRKAFVVPGSPSANGHPKAVDVEALAALAFAEDAQQQVPVDQRKVKMVCAMCDATWDEPWDRQGKNVLCPECKHRQKVPEQKAGKVDWRDPKAGRPSLAKVDKLEDVVTSTDSSHAGFESLKQAGVIEDNIEPRPKWHYVAVVVIPLLVLGLAVYAGMLLFRSNKESKRDEYMTEAVKAMLDAPADVVPPNESPLFRAAILLADGEHHARAATDAKGSGHARESFAKARTELDGATPSGGRDVLLSELAILQVLLGGGPDEVTNGTRIRWVQPPAGTTRGKISEKEYNVQDELRLTVSAMLKEEKSSALDVRIMTVRRLARELAKRGQASVLNESLITRMFTDAEQVEAQAWANVEQTRATGGDLDGAAKSLITALKAPQTLPPGGDSVSDGTRVAHTARLLLQSNAAEAMALARRGGEPEGRAKALALIAEWGDEATAAEAVREAAGVVAAISAKSSRPSDYLLVRLATAAGRTGQAEQAEVFAKAINKDDYRAWARAEALRAALATEGTKVADAGRAALPDTPRDYRVGQAWARMAVARHNAKATGASGANDQLRDIGIWPEPFKHFGKAGLALGLLDHEGK